MYAATGNFHMHLRCNNYDLMIAKAGRVVTFPGTATNRGSKPVKSECGVMLAMDKSLHTPNEQNMLLVVDEYLGL